MTTFTFHQVDVFSDRPLMGNPLAVVHDADALTTEDMARFARWTNLSETTFVLPPTDARADYRVRIFTPGQELPFAGHPTLGTCWAWLQAGGVPAQDGVVVQECGIGLVTVKVQGTQLAFAAPPLLRSGPLDEALVQRIARALGVQRADIVHHQWVVNGPEFCAVMLPSAEQVRALRPDFAALADLKLGVIGPQAPGSPTDFEVRGFVVPSGVNEDPVTGSLNAGLAVWLMQSGLAPQRYSVTQGTALGRAGRVSLHKEGDTIWVGGAVSPCVEGRLSL
ncbi:MAG: hypothetical protein RL111_2249 [Pseudomonadota bacterium]|jgi:PhzF family phenazine biosynthesis protein